MGQRYLVDDLRLNDKGDGYNVVGFLRTPVVSLDALKASLGFGTTESVQQEVVIGAGVDGDDLPF